MSNPDRRRFLGHAVAGASALATGCTPRLDRALEESPAWQPPAVKPFAGKSIPGGIPFPGNRPNVILVRFGGGVRRKETIADPTRTFCPFIRQELAGKHGILFDNVEIANLPGIDTSHGQGTLYILTGEYRQHRDTQDKTFADRFESPLPTIPEYLRKRYTDLAEHHTLIIDSEDRPNSEFYTFSNHHAFGLAYRSTVLSLHEYQTYLLRQDLAKNSLSDRQRAAKQTQLGRLLSRDSRASQMRGRFNPRVDAFWASWRRTYGDSGLVHPRGDRLLTALALRALEELRPRFLMINYQDPDYVHWGPAHFYTRAITIIDEGVREIHKAVQADEFYRDNTVFVVVPDCGRDDNPVAAVPFQHHFQSRSAHQVFAIVAGPAKFVPRGGRSVSRLQQQISVAATVGELMGYQATEADAGSLFEVV